MLVFVVVSMYLEQGGVLTQRLLLGDPAEESPDRVAQDSAAPALLVAHAVAERDVTTDEATDPDTERGTGTAPEPVPSETVPPATVAPAAATVRDTVTDDREERTPAPVPTTAPAPAPETLPARPAAAAHDAPVSQPTADDVLAPAAGLRWGALTTGASSVSLRDADVVDTMSGILFAAYVAGGGAAAKRVSGWVSVRATPPSLDAEQFPVGADLRGKVGRVATILDCDDLGATWVVLQPRVDIARGLVRSPVTDPVLEGLLVWWRAAQSLPTVLSTAEAADLAAAIAAVEDRLADHPWSEAVDQLRTALLDGVVNEREVLLGIAGRGDLATDRAGDAPPAGQDGAGRTARDGAGRTARDGAPGDPTTRVSSGRGPATRPRAPRS